MPIFLRSFISDVRNFWRAPARVARKLFGGAPAREARNFWRANGANVAMMFGLSLIPLTIAAGAGIDFARAVMVHQAMAEALDSAALAVGSSTPSTTSCSSDGTATGNSGSNPCTAYQQLAQKYFDQNYGTNYSAGATNTMLSSNDVAYGTPAPVSITVNGQSVTLSSSLQLKLTLLGIGPIDALSPNIKASSTVVWGQTKLWVSLVLDNTGSMCQTDSNPTASSCNGDPVGSKIAALKTATQSLLTMLQGAAATAGDVRAAIIPFVKDVNIGASAFVSSPSIDWTDWNIANGSCNLSGKNSYTSCVAAHGTWTGTVGACNIASVSTQSSCTSTRGSWTAASCSIASITSQSSCTSTHGVWTAASCSIAGITSQSSCTSTRGTWTAASCNISGITSQNSCTSTHATWSTTRGVSSCNISTYTTKTACQAAYGTWTAASCTISGISSQNTCTNTYGSWTAASCTIGSITSQSSCTSTYGVWTAAACTIGSITSQSTCTSTSGTWTWTSGTCSISISGYNGSQSVCTSTTATWTPDSHTTWNGCVTDRGNDSGPDTTNNYDVEDTSPTTGVTASQFSAEQYSPCPVSIKALSYTWADLSSQVTSMKAGGGTNQPIGLVWGWHALTTGDPMYAPTLPANTSRYIIILSDGLNTQDRWYGDGSNQSTQVDDRMSKVCTYAKADKIVIYAIYVDIGGTQGNSTVLQNCASDSSKYYDLTSASQISAAFTQIGQQITNLRVSN